MIRLSKIMYPELLKENYHLNFYNIEFNDSELKEYINNIKNSFTNILITNVESTQEFTDEQKKLLQVVYPNLTHFLIK